MKRYAEFNEQRTYGIEIEFLENSIPRSKIAQELRDAGINAQAERYNHITTSYWKMTTDSTCGNELVSPILKGRDGLEEIKKVCKVLNKLGCKVNKSCGLHVHHGVGDLNVKDFRNLYISSIKYEGLIDQLHPISRRDSNNSYCLSLKRICGYDGDYERIVKKISSCKCIDDIKNIFYSRYIKLNFQSYIKYGTVEFRQHAGTLDSSKIINWILFTQLMVERSKFSIIKKLEREYDHLGCLYNMLGISRKVTCSEEMFKMGKFFRARAKELKGVA